MNKNLATDEKLSFHKHCHNHNVQSDRGAASPSNCKPVYIMSDMPAHVHTQPVWPQKLCDGNSSVTRAIQRC